MTPNTVLSNLFFTIAISSVFQLSSQSFNVAQAGPNEEAYQQCIEGCYSFLNVGLMGVPAHVAGCLAAYTIAKANEDEPTPKFTFTEKQGCPKGKPKHTIVFFVPGEQELLSAGLYGDKGEPLSKNSSDIEKVTFEVLSLDDFHKLKSFDTDKWTPVEGAKFNADRNLWETKWDTTDSKERMGYLVRTKFYDRNGTVHQNFALAIHKAIGFCE